MRKRGKGRKRRAAKSFWQSYSDMMAAMMLVFVLILSAITLRSQETAEQLDKTREAYNDAIGKQESDREEWESEAEGYENALSGAEKVISDLMDEKGRLESEIGELESELMGFYGKEKAYAELESEKDDLDSRFSSVLDENRKIRKENTGLKSENDAFKKRNSEIESENQGYQDTIGVLESENEDYKTRNAVLESENDAFKAQNDLYITENTDLRTKITDIDGRFEEVSKKLEDIVGIRREIIEALSREFDDTQLAVNQQTGAITLRSELLFDANSAELNTAGKEFLEEFFPKYVGILMGDEFRDYVAEIIIEGHTDTRRGYLFNLNLSQRRALAVAAYLLPDEEDISLHTLNAEDSGIFSEEEKSMLRHIVTVNGRSWVDPVYDENHEVDLNASRRVEILFRLKDDEMIREMADTFTGEAPDGRE